MLNLFMSVDMITLRSHFSSKLGNFLVSLNFPSIFSCTEHYSSLLQTVACLGFVLLNNASISP